MEQVLGRKVVEEIEFKIARTEDEACAGRGADLSNDEADLIPTRFSGLYYKAARKRANS